jgi:hypothetical protein
MSITWRHFKFQKFTWKEKELLRAQGTPPVILQFLRIYLKNSCSYIYSADFLE